MSEYNRELLTEREKEYFDCDIEVKEASALSVAGNIVMSFLAAVARALLTPSSDYAKADRRLVQNIRTRQYVKYKKAVLRKAKGEPLKGDEKLLQKLNKRGFVLYDEVFDPDEYTRQVYDEYMNAHPELFEKEEK